MARLAPIVPEFQTPEQRTESAVTVQMIIVSTKTSAAPHSPCATGWGVSADPWMSGDDPCPASLELMERANPVRTVAATEAPMNPPLAAVGVKADLIIIANTAGTRLKFNAMMPTPPSR